MRNPSSGAPGIQWLLDNYTSVQSDRVLRSGSWFNSAALLRSADRRLGNPTYSTGYYGFRCVRAVSPFPEGMVFIPAGEFEMGSNDGDGDEQPIHTVYVDAFYMDKYEVTNAEYAVFLNEMGKHRERDRTWYKAGAAAARIALLGGRYEVREGYENHPVTGVTWYGAMAYARWVGKRLPTEAEWEKAARGGLSGTPYPWGKAEADATHANFNWNLGNTVAVGNYPPNGYGLYDMVGNVAEWCLDEYKSSFYSVFPVRNPLSGAESIQWLLDNYTGVGSLRVLRGGSWFSSASNLRSANRDYGNPKGAYATSGFRCARAVSP